MDVAGMLLVTVGRLPPVLPLAAVVGEGVARGEGERVTVWY
jgi:hypothetical protein